MEEKYSNEQEITPPVIRISFDEKEGHLIFEDNQGHRGHFITTSVWRNTRVTWKVVKGQDIIITKIYPKPDSQNIFEGDGPVEQPGGPWMGTVSPNASGIESYNVDYKVGGKDYSDDPDLEVRD